MSAIEFTPEQLENAMSFALGGVFDADRLTREIGARYGVTIGQVKSPSRVKTIVAARREVAIRLRERGWSYPEIGHYLGGRDHTTIMGLVKTRLAAAGRSVA